MQLGFKYLDFLKLSHKLNARIQKISSGEGGGHDKLFNFSHKRISQIPREGSHGFSRGTRNSISMENYSHL